MYVKFNISTNRMSRVWYQIQRRKQQVREWLIILIVVGELTAFSELLLMNDDSQTEVFHMSTCSRNTHGSNQLYCMAGDGFPTKMLSVLSQQQQQQQQYASNNYLIMYSNPYENVILVSHRNQWKTVKNCSVLVGFLDTSCVIIPTTAECDWRSVILQGPT